jgi:hypothetical protein
VHVDGAECGMCSAWHTHTLTMLNVGTHARAHCTHNGKQQDAAETPSRARARTQSSDRNVVDMACTCTCALSSTNPPCNPTTHKPVHAPGPQKHQGNVLIDGHAHLSTPESAHYVVHSHHHPIASVNTRTAHDALSLCMHPPTHTVTPIHACMAIATCTP